MIYVGPFMAQFTFGSSTLLTVYEQKFLWKVGQSETPGGKVRKAHAVLIEVIPMCYEVLK